MIIEGLLILNDIKLRDLIDHKVFVDAPKNLRIKRRLDRDINQRGRTAEEVIELFNSRLNKMHNLYVEPMKKICDIIIDNNKENSLEIAPLINVIKSHL
jgi:uridine kinase